MEVRLYPICVPLQLGYARRLAKNIRGYRVKSYRSGLSHGSIMKR